MQIELVYITTQSEEHCSALIMKSSFIEVENINLNFTSVVVYQECYKYLIFQWDLKKLASSLPAFRRFYHPPFSHKKI